MRNNTERKWPARSRYVILVLGVLLFLPPLCSLFQLTGDERFWLGEICGLYLSGYQRSYVGMMLFGAVLTTTFFFGRHWCSHLCPVGGVMELGSRLVPRFLKIKYSGIPAPAFRYGCRPVQGLRRAGGHPASRGCQPLPGDRPAAGILGRLAWRPDPWPLRAGRFAGQWRGGSARSNSNVGGCTYNRKRHFAPVFANVASWPEVRLTP